MTVRTKAELYAALSGGPYDHFRDLLDTLFTAVPAGGGGLSAYQHVIVVDPSGIGDHTTVGAAMAAIPDAASTKRYLIILFGKTTETADFTWKRYVSLAGLSEGHAEISGAYTILFASGSDGDQQIANVKISAYLGTSVASARMEFVNCRLTGGLTLSHNSSNFLVRGGTWSGKLDKSVATSGTTEFRDCAVTVSTTWDVLTQTYFGGTFSCSVALGTITNISFYNCKSVAISTSGGITLAAGTLQFVNCTGTLSKISHTGGTLGFYNAQLSGSAGSDNLVELIGAVTFYSYWSSIVNTGASGRGLYIDNGSANPTLFRAICSLFSGLDVGVDSASAYVADVFHCQIKGTPLSMAANAGTALGTSVLF